MVPFLETQPWISLQQSRELEKDWSAPSECLLFLSHFILYLFMSLLPLRWDLSCDPGCVALLILLPLLPEC